LILAVEQCDVSGKFGLSDRLWGSKSEWKNEEKWRIKETTIQRC
jgi:hypothetical protein